MKRCFLYSAFLLSVLLGALPLQAQNNQGPDQVELRSGEVISGTIVEYRPDDFVKLALSDGSVKTYLIEAVRQIRQGADLSSAEEVLPSQDGSVLELAEKRNDQTSNEGEAVLEAEPTPKADSWANATYEFRERGLFHATSFAFSFGKRATADEPVFNPFGPNFESEKTAIGFNIQHITGFQFNRMVGVGLGMSYDAYDLEEGEAIFTIFSHYRGYLSKTIVSPYLGLSAGYGFAFRNEEQGITEAEGGWMVHPEVGVRLGASNKTNFTISAGYRLQKAYYTQELPFNGDIQYRDLIYRRFLFSLGLLF